MKSFRERTDNFQRSLIRGSLRRNRGSQAAAARELGLRIHTLSYQLDRLGINASAYKPKPNAHRESTKRWKQRKIAEGWCANCFKNRPGGEGGSVTCCPSCAKAKCLREQKRMQRKRLNATPRIAAPEKRGRIQDVAEQENHIEKMLAISATISSLQRPRGFAQEKPA